MKCPRKEKNCKPSICFMTKKGNYICSGISTKPSKFKEDKVWLCRKGKLSQTNVEMTKAEAFGTIAALSASNFTLSGFNIHE